MTTQPKKYMNYMEEAVEGLVYEVVKNMNICKCERCILDIIALSLNELLPRYVVCQKGMTYTKLNYLDPQFEIDVMATITKAAQIVNANKRHE
jgi:competence protein ComFB